MELFLKINKRASPFIREVRVCSDWPWTGRRQILLIKAFLTLVIQKEKTFVGFTVCHFH